MTWGAFGGLTAEVCNMDSARLAETVSEGNCCSDPVQSTRQVSQGDCSSCLCCVVQNSDMDVGLPVLGILQIEKSVTLEAVSIVEILPRWKAESSFLSQFEAASVLPNPPFRSTISVWLL